MRLQSLSIRNFRNIEHADLQIPHVGFTLVGENGQGKTNLLEAIHYLQLLRSMRGVRDQDIIMFDAPAFHIASTIVGEDRKDSPQTETSGHQLSTGFERRGKKKKIVIDGVVAKKLSDAFGTLPSVVISPKDTELIAGSPAERRTFLDILLSLTVPQYLQTLQRYKATLARRNAALRAGISPNHGTSQGTSIEDSVRAWEPSLARLGASIIKTRSNWINQNSAMFTQLTTGIGERETVTLDYATQAKGEDIESALLELYDANRYIDGKLGVTRCGPHRDDMVVAIGGRDLRSYGSAGQQRTAAIALRLLEFRSLQASLATQPLLLLDDPFAELDERRSSNILKLLSDSDLGQVIIAVPRETDVPREFDSLPRWSISSGVISGSIDSVSNSTPNG